MNRSYLYPYIEIRRLSISKKIIIVAPITINYAQINFLNCADLIVTT